MNTLEKTIITALLRDMQQEGYRAAAIWTGEDYVVAGQSGLIEISRDAGGDGEPVARPLTEEEVFSVFTDYDMATPTIHFTHKGLMTWGNRGVMVIEGNGEDIISDYHVAEGESFGSVIDHIYAQLETGQTLL